MAARDTRPRPHGRVKKIAIDRESIQALEEGSDEPVAAPYTISLANSSNWVVVAVRRKDRGETIPVVKPVGRNCLAGCQKCREAGNYEPILVVACDQPDFDLTLILRHPSGFKGESESFTIRPSCLYTGRVLCLAAADPA
jgi:hypothetical protein